MFLGPESAEFLAAVLIVRVQEINTIALIHIYIKILDGQIID